MKNKLCLLLILSSFVLNIHAQKSIRIGIIGLDTSHSVAFTDLINGDKDNAFAKRLLESLRPIRMVQKLLNPVLSVFRVILRK